MRKSTLLAAAAALLVAAWWHWPAAAQRTPQPADAEQTISFEQYREFRMHDLQQRRERLAHQLDVPGLTAAEKTSIERRRTYWDQLAAMPAEERDQLFRERFDQIDTNHDGKLDAEERAAWREKQREYYRQQASERAHSGSEQR
ncbi:MAG: EF-hand domain-containing protein [Stellaceae bacterium]